jgi:hypothetical protein
VDVGLTEGDSGTTNAVFQIKLSATSGQEVRARCVTDPGTAAQGSDYLYTAESVFFSPGQRLKTVSVPVIGDTLHEVTENFVLRFLSIGNATATTEGASATATIIDNDTLPSLSIDDVTEVEGNSGTTDLYFSVNLSEFSTETVKVNYVTRGISANEGTDYVAASGTLIFPAGEISQIIKVSVRTDRLVESNEQFNVELSSAVGATIAKRVGVGTIANDDVTAASSPSSGGS